MANKSSDNRFWIILFVIIFLIVIIIYFASLGNIDPVKQESDLELEDRKKLAALRHQKLQRLIERKTELKVKLERSFKRAYFLVRVFLVLLYILLNCILLFVFDIKDFGILLSYNQWFWICFLILNFISFGTITNLKSVMQYFKNMLENWVYLKYGDIDEQIKKHKRDSDELREYLENK